MSRSLCLVSLCLISSLLLPLPLMAQEGARLPASPYADMLDRDIKALAPAEVEALLLGDVMGFAPAAELNGYPGPKHVLELADPLALTTGQRDRVHDVMEEMGAEARRLGARLVAAERALDRSFAERTVQPVGLRAAVLAIATLRGELRALHLSAHLRTQELLTPHQRQLYQRLRGYGGAHVHPTGG